MNVILLQHDDIESAGRLGVSFQNMGHRLDFRRPDRDGSDALPTNLKYFDGVIVMGGPQSLDAAGFAESPWLKAESELIAQAHAAEMPIIGVCLGAQLIAHALGGTVQAMEKPEVGFAPVQVTTAGQVNAIMAGIAWQSPQFQVHAYEVAELPAGATLLATSSLCTNQAFKVGLRTYGFQFHFECDRAMINAFHVQCRDLFERTGLTDDDFAGQVECDYAMYERTADRLCDTIAQLAFPFVSA